MKNVRSLVMILTVALVLVFSSVIVCNAETVASGECGENATWVLDETGKLIISGTGEMWDYSLSNKSPFSSTTKIQSVVIENGVTSIGYHAFDNDYKITSITIPDSVTTIKSAFEGCSGLKTISIPGSVNNIDGNLFRYCSNMTSIDVDETNTSYRSIDGILYDYNCTRLIACPVKKSSIKVPDSLITIEGYACYRCRELTSIKLSDNVTTIGEYAFYDCALTSITLPDSLTTIGEYAFSYNNLTSIQIPASVTFIGGHIVSGCSGMMSIDVDANNTEYCSIDGILYDKECRNLYECPANKDSVTIPDSVSHITQSAFANCNKLTNIVIPDTVTSIGGYAFVGCSSLTSIIIPDGIWYIQQSTFDGCSSLDSITLPESVTNIDVDAFRNCTSLTDVYFKGEKKQWDSISIYSGNDSLLNADIHYGGIDLCPVIWEWEKDNFNFTNSKDYFGNRENSYYITSEDFAYLLSNLNNTEIAQMALWNGKGSRETPRLKLRNFLTKHFVDWSGSCYGMSLTAALFATGKKDSKLYGGSNTYSIPALNPEENSSLESAINYYQFLSACNNAIKGTIVDPVETGTFSKTINRLYERARNIGKTYEPIMVILYGDMDDNGEINEGDKAHAVLCYGVEDGEWEYDGRVCDRRLLIADPNKKKENHILISKDSTFAVYLGNKDYDWFGYIEASLDDLNSLDYNESLNTMAYNIILDTRDSIMIVGKDPYCKVFIKDGKFYIDENSRDFYIDTVNMMSDDENDTSSNMFYRISGKSKQYQVLPYEDEPVNATLFFDDYAVDLQGSIQSANVANDGQVSIEGAEGNVEIGLVANDSDFTFTDISGTADGDVQISLSDNHLSVSGDIADYSISNLDKQGQENEINVSGDTDGVITINENNELAIDENNTCNHEWNSNYTVDVPATCVAEGSKSIHCKKCGVVKTGSSKAIPKLKVHNYSAWKITKKATELAKGKKTRRCKVCGKTETATIAMLKPTLKAVKIITPKAAKGSATIKWKKVTKKNLKKTKKIQIQYSTDKNFKKGVKTKYASAKKTSYKIKDLKKGKKYYVRIRAYMKSGKTVHVSKWSAKKLFKAK